MHNISERITKREWEKELKTLEDEISNQILKGFN